MGFVLLRQILALNENSRLYRSAQAEITLRQKVDEALRASERKYREFADSLPQIVYELDARVIIFLPTAPPILLLDILNKSSRRALTSYRHSYLEIENE